MTVHELKTWPVYFQAVASGAKTFEVRRDDRPFEVGDVLHLREWSAEAGGYTGESVRRRVTYVLRDGMAFGVCSGFVVLGLGNSYPEVREHCRACRHERDKIVPAEFIVWGKYAPPNRLGPSCYDHTAEVIGHAGMSRIDQYAVFDLRPFRAAGGGGSGVD